MATSTVSPAASPVTPAPAKVKKPKRRKLTIFLFALLVISCAAAMAGYFLSDYFNASRPASAASRPAADPIYIALTPMTVNLQANDRHRFLHVGVTLKVNDTKSQALVTQYLPEVTSRMQLVLSNRQSESLITATDKARLVAEALEALNRPFGPNQPALRISSVMFPVFMLQ
jgi:flagellar FliL protein